MPAVIVKPDPLTIMPAVIVKPDPLTIRPCVAMFHLVPCAVIMYIGILCVFVDSLVYLYASSKMPRLSTRTSWLPLPSALPKNSPSTNHLWPLVPSWGTCCDYPSGRVVKKHVPRAGTASGKLSTAASPVSRHTCIAQTQTWLLLPWSCSLSSACRENWAWTASPNFVVPLLLSSSSVFFQKVCPYHSIMNCLFLLYC